MKMKLKREIRLVFLAVMFITLTCAGAFAEMDVGPDYSLGGYISLGGGWLSDQPRHMDRAYLKQYLPFPQGFLADTELSLKSKDGLEYYKFRMSHPGLRDQDFLIQLGKLGVYHAEIEYDQLQHLYCTVNPLNNNIGILLQRLRFSGYYSPTPEIAIFAENDFLRRTGWQPGSYLTGPPNAYNFTTYLRPIDYKQNDLRTGVEYDQPSDQNQPSVFQGRVSYHLSTFENGQADLLGRTPPVGTNAFVSLPPSNMANYITAEGALNLKSYMTRISGSLSYGWLSQNDYVFQSTTGAGPPPTVAGRFNGLAGLSASTFTADIAGLTRPITSLALRYSYRAYNYSNDNTANQILRTAYGDDQNLLNAMQYSYFRQAVNLGADYRVNNMLAFTVGYTWRGVSRTDGQGRTSSNSPQVGVRLVPTDWLSLLANYAYTSRTGSNFLWYESAAAPTAILTYKTYAGSLNRNNFNIIAEVCPVNTVTCSLNFSIYNDNFTNSAFGLQSDRGWSGGADVSWRPHDRVALSLGYDHQQLQTKELVLTFPIMGETAVVTGDAGPTLTTSDSYDTFVARADIKLIPKKLNLTTRASYSIANSNFNNATMPSLNEYFADIRTYLTYQFNEHWACRAGYIFQIFGMSDAYRTLYVQGITAAGVAGSNQQYNTLDGFYRNATAHVVQGFLQYKF
jgi:Putative outer membrane beta-barrel porin, MtrB/PioB